MSRAPSSRWSRTPTSGEAVGSPARAPRPCGLLLVAVGLLAVELLAPACDLSLPGRVARTPGADGGPLPVVFLAHRRPASLPAEERAALEWSRSREELDVRVVHLVDLPTARIPEDAVLWWHYAEAAALPSDAVTDTTLAAARRHLRRGGGAVLTLLAASWTVPLGLETTPPDTVGTAVAAPGPAPGTRGLQSRAGHPALRRFWGGVDLDRVGPREPIPAAFYSADRWPEQGRVWAVEKRGGSAAPEIRAGIEYPPTRERPGTLITAGAHVRFAAGNDTFGLAPGPVILDLLGHAAGRTPPDPPGVARRTSGTTNGERPSSAPGSDSHRQAGSPLLSRTTWWERTSGPPVRRFRAAPGPGVPGVVDPGPPGSSGPGLVVEPTDETRFTLAGSRAVARLTGRGRIEALWTHPQVVLSDLRFGVVRPEEPVAWLDAVGERRLVRHPGTLEIQWRLPARQLEVVVELAVPPGLPALVARFVVRAPEPVDVVAAWRANHGPGWLQSGPAGSAGPLLLARQERAGGAIWRDLQAEFHALAGFSRGADRGVVGYQPWRHLGPGGLQEVDDSRSADESLGSASVALQVSAEPGEPGLAFVVTGRQGELAETEETWAALLAEPAAAFVRAGEASGAAPGARPEIRTDQPEINEALRWLRAGLLRLKAVPPGADSPVLAAAHRGATSDLGADALWGVLAANDLGEHALAVATLRHLARHQQPDGRIPGRLLPMGPSAASPEAATPLFLLAVEDTVTATGDVGLADDLWPALEAALAACSRADRDGDGLMDHHEPPSPPLDVVAGLVAEVSLAGLHAAAVEAATRLARTRGDTAAAARLESRAQALRESLNGGFWDGAARYHRLGRTSGGPLRVRTVFPALPLALGMLNPGEGSALLEPLASAGMSTDWGVAWLDGTHVGPGGFLPGPPEVFPAHTAWTALAEYRAHRPVPAWNHLATQLDLLLAGGGRLPGRLRGDRREELDGAGEEISGYALTAVALIRGSLGVRADAIAGTLEIVPHLPGAWGRVSLDPVRVGPHAFRVTLQRTGDALVYTFDWLEGVGAPQPVELLLGARVPGNVLVNLDRDLLRGVELVADEVIDSSQFDRAARVRVRPTATRFVVGFRHGPHPRLILDPVVPPPGRASTGLRVGGVTWRDGRLSFPVEGLPGRDYLLRLATPWPVDAVTGIPGATAPAPGPGTAEIRFAIPGIGDRHRRVQLEVTFER